MIKYHKPREVIRKFYTNMPIVLKIQLIFIYFFSCANCVRDLIINCKNSKSLYHKIKRVYVYLMILTIVFCYDWFFLTNL